MENLTPGNFKCKIVPLARKKLLAQALLKDSPLKFAASRKIRSSRHSVNSSISSLENTSVIAGYSSLIASPLREKDLNNQGSFAKIPIFKLKERKYKSQEGLVTNIKNSQDFFVKLWKCNKMNTQIDNSLRIETQQIFYALPFKQESAKIVSFITELNAYIQKNSTFPSFLSPYLEEIICGIPLVFPLVKGTCSIFEAETLLSLVICRFSVKKIEVIYIQKLRKLKNNIDQDIIGMTWILLSILSEIDENLQEIMKKFENRQWDLFMEYTVNPGFAVQNIRKIPESLRKFEIHQSKI